MRRGDGHSEHCGFQFPQTIASLPGSLAHSFSPALAGSLDGCLWWELGRMRAGQEVKRTLVLNPAITNRKSKPFDDAFM